jgi:hypothetical protein
MVAGGAALYASAMMGRAAPAKIDDPIGVLRKPIPDKVVVLTFDDGPASGYTVVAPILKSFGFRGSFYICDFGSFRTRKDWYLTWRQMKAMSDQGLEIGNHTTGHAGGCGIGYFLSMEDDLVANGVPKPTTITWPLCQVNTSTYPDLVAAGYTFGRGGHFRPYRPTVDNPFDIPCLGGNSLEAFVKSVRQAAGGKIVTLCYHGVPDMEHTAVSLDPAIFKAQMQYLKDNTPPADPEQGHGRDRNTHSLHARSLAADPAGDSGTQTGREHPCLHQSDQGLRTQGPHAHASEIKGNPSQTSAPHAHPS